MDEPPAKRTKLSGSPLSNDNSDIAWSSILSDFNSKLPDELGNIQIDESSFLNPNGSTDSLLLQDACSSASSAPINDHLSQLLSAAAAASGVSAAASSSPSPAVGSRFPGSATSVVGNLQSLPMQIHVSMGKMQMPLTLAAINKNSTALATSGPIVAASNSVSNMIATVPRLNAMTLVRTNRPALISQSHGLGVVGGPTGSILTTASSVMASTTSVGNAMTWPVSMNMTNVNLAPNSMIIAVDQNPQLVALQRAGAISRFPQKIVKVSAPVGGVGTVSQLNLVPSVSMATPVGLTSAGGGLTQQTMMTLRAPAPSHPPPPQPVVQPTVSQPPPLATGTADPEKRRLIQQQLVLLLHAHKCQRREQANGTPIQPCQLPHCQTMKNVLNHMSDCHKGKACKVPHCASSRQIITHWKNCTRSDCPVCLPLKNASDRRGGSGTSIAQPTKGAIVVPMNNTASSLTQPFADLDRAYRALGLAPPSQQQQQILLARQSPMAPSLGSSGATCSAGLSSSGAMQLWSDGSGSAMDGIFSLAKSQGSMTLPAVVKTESTLTGGIATGVTGFGVVSEVPNHPVKEWHQSVTKDLRSHLVDKLVQAIFPTPDPSALKDKRINNLVQYARKVEGDMYETANSREEYYHLLAEKIYKIQKELEEKRLKRIKELGGSIASLPLASGNAVMSTAALRLPLQNGPMTLAGQLLSLATSSASSCIAGGDQQSLVSAITLGAIGPYLGGGGAGGGTGGISTASLCQPLSISTSQADPKPIFSHHQPVVVFPASLTSVGSTSSTSLQIPVQQQQQPHQFVLQQQQQQPGINAQHQILPNIFSPLMPTGASSSAMLLSSPTQSMMLHLPTPPRQPSSDEAESGTKSDLLELDSTAAAGAGTSSCNPVFESGATEEPKQEDSRLEEKETDMQVEFKLEGSLDEAAVLGGEVKMEHDGGSMSLDGMKNEGDQGSCGSAQSSPPKPPIDKKTWKPNELRQVLMPILEKLYRMEPESLPFRQAVDPVLLQIPDYFDIIKKPMDLSMIKRKLDTGQYKDPWQYVDDVWLMFDNAWLYNRKTSKVHKFCTKLSETFEVDIDNVMRSLGFCCGRKYVFCPQVLCCYGKPMCTIPVHATYFSYQNRYVYCEKCFLEIQGTEVELIDDPSRPGIQIQKDLFQKTKNSDLELEPFVECTYCGRKQHQICSLHMEQIWPNEFICASCAGANNMKRRENKYTAKRLPQTKLGTYLENRVNSFLKKKDAGAGEVMIRVLASSEKVVEVKPGMKQRYVESMADSFPYVAKAIFAFEEIDGADVCFFGMHVQEYGSNSLAPNARRIYLAYLDSVNFFQPKHIRTSVYHEILIGYLDYVKNLGYTMAHIWACPPSEGDDYIFHCHPLDMKIPKPKRLQEWYKKMLDKAIIERVVIDYKDVLKDAIESNMKSVVEMPYFEGDFWPNVLEESIKELDQEEEDKRRREEVEAATTVEAEETTPEGEDVGEQTGKKKGQKGSTATKKKNSKSKNSTQRKSGKKCGQPPMGNDLAARLFATMEKHKEVFFVIRLHSTQAATNLPAIKDPDPFVTNDLMDGRDAFLLMAREKHYEFSSLRRAKFSTLAMVYELHTLGKDNFVYTCNSCKANIVTHYHCNTCDDFDLCVSCYLKDGHPHKMEKLGLDLDDGTSAGEEQQQNPQEARRLSIQRCIQSLVHACQCRDANCRLMSCQKMKRVMAHTKLCKRKTNAGCPVCKQLIALCCYHAKHCHEAKCAVPFCIAIKQKLHHQQLQQRLQQAHMMRRRMAAMQRGMQVTVPVQMAPSFAPAPVVAPNSDAGSSAPPKPVLDMALHGKPSLQTFASHKPDQLIIQQQQLQQQLGIPNISGVLAGASPASAPSVDPPVSLRHGILMTALQQQPRFAAPIQQVVSVSESQQQDWKVSFGNQLVSNAGSAIGIASQQQQPVAASLGLPIVAASVGTGALAAGTASGAAQQPSNTSQQMALQKLLVTLRSPSSQLQRQQVLNILKANPHLMNAFFKRPAVLQQPESAVTTTQSLPIGIQLTAETNPSSALLAPSPASLLQSIPVGGTRMMGIARQPQLMQQLRFQQPPPQMQFHQTTPGGAPLQARIISSISQQLMDAGRNTGLGIQQPPQLQQQRTIGPHYSVTPQAPQGMIIVQQNPGLQLQIKQQLIGVQSSSPLNTSSSSSPAATVMVAATNSLQDNPGIAQASTLQAAMAAAQTAASSAALRSPHLMPGLRMQVQAPSQRLTLAGGLLSASGNVRQVVRPTLTLLTNHGPCRVGGGPGPDLQGKVNPADQVLLSPLQTTFQPNLDLAGLSGSLVNDGSITPLTPQDQLSRYVEQL